MGFIQRLFGSKQRTERQVSDSAELSRLRELDVLMNGLLAGDHYVARSEYQDAFETYKDLPDWFRVLKDSGTLEVFCNNNGTSSEEVTDILSRFKSFPELVDSQNEQYVKAAMISEKEYLDNILKDSDPNIILDEDQRRVVLTDEDYCLVVAGAGAGKTTTVAAKVFFARINSRKLHPKMEKIASPFWRKLQAARQGHRGTAGTALQTCY